MRRLGQKGSGEWGCCQSRQKVVGLETRACKPRTDCGPTVAADVLFGLHSILKSPFVNWEISHQNQPDVETLWKNEKIWQFNFVAPPLHANLNDGSSGTQREGCSWEAFWRQKKQDLAVAEDPALKVRKETFPQGSWGWRARLQDQDHENRWQDWKWGRGS